MLAKVCHKNDTVSTGRKAIIRRIRSGLRCGARPAGRDRVEPPLDTSAGLNTLPSLGVAKSGDAVPPSGTCATHERLFSNPRRLPTHLRTDYASLFCVDSHTTFLLGSYERS